MSNYILGLDVALSDTGVTVYDLDNHKIVEVFTISTNHIRENKGNKHLYLNSIKLLHIYSELIKVQQEYNPKTVVIERGFSRFNVATQNIYRVHGVVNLIFNEASQIYYPPKTIKEVIIHGSATKNEVKYSIREKYNDISFNNEDESDSFAIVLTYLIKENLIEWEKPKRSYIKKLIEKDKEEMDNV